MIHSFQNTRLVQIINSHPYAFPLKALAETGTDTELAELLWLQSHQNILQFLQTVPASRHYTVKFENLVNRPQATVESLCEFLEVPFHPNMLQPYQDQKQRMTDGVQAEGRMLGDVKFHRHRQIEAQAADAWKQTYQDDFLSDLTWAVAEQLNYPRSATFAAIPLQPQGSQPPLFCLPGAGGYATYFRALATHLGENQPCYGLQSPGLDGHSHSPSTIEELASHYLKEVQRVQPQGPYYLAGHSFGGRVAFELTRQLEQRGETVALLVIFDTTPVSTDLKANAEIATRTELDWLWDLVDILEELTHTNLGLTRDQAPASVAQTYKWVMQAFKQQEVFFAPTAGSDQLQALVETFRTQVLAHSRYQPPGPVKAPIALFRAQDFPDSPDSVLSSDWGWEKYTTGAMTWQWTPGTHITMLTEPQVRTLAAHLQRWLH
jgi:thioesterase domain-containing protein